MEFERPSAEAISDKIIKEMHGDDASASMDMDQIDQLIRDILMEREAAEREAANRELTPDEELSLYRELEEEARTLTFQLKKLRSPSLITAEEAQPVEQPISPAEEAEPVFEEPEFFKPVAEPVENEQKFFETVTMAVEEEPEPESFETVPQPAAEPVSFDEPLSEESMEDIPAEEPQSEPVVQPGAAFFQSEEPDGETDNFPDFEIPARVPSAPTVLQPEQYRKYRKSRNERMENFTLDPATDPAEAKVDLPIEEEPTEAPGTDAVPSLEYTCAEDKGTVRSFLCKKRRIGRLLRLLCLLLMLPSAYLSTAVAGSDHFTLLFGLQLSPALYLGLQIALFLAVLFLSVPIFASAISSLRQHRPNKDRLLALALLFYLPITCYLIVLPKPMLSGEVSPVTPLALLALFAAFSGRSQRFYTLRRNFDWLTGGKLTHAARVSEKLWSVQNVPVSFFDGFVAHGLSSDEGDRFSSVLTKVGMMLGFILMLVAYLASNSISLAISMLPAMLLLCTGILPMVLTSLPLQDSMVALRRWGCSTPTSADTAEYDEAISVCLQGSSLFPADAVALRGIKSYQGKQIDLAIVDAASVMSKANSLLSPVLLDVMAGNADLLKPVDELVYEPLLGIAAWVDNKRVLIGNRQMMINHSIAIPKVEQIGGGLSHDPNGDPVWTEIVYLSSQGQLCATFSVELRISDQALSILDLLRRYELTGYLYSMDSCLTPDLLMALFHADESVLQIMSATAVKHQEKETEPLDRAPLQLATNGSDFGLLLGVAACKRLRLCFGLGKFLHSFAIALGALWTILTLLQSKPAWAYSLPLFLLSVFSGLGYWIYQKNQKF